MKKNKLLYNGRCITINKMSGEVFIYENTEIALKESIKMNLADEEHPSFWLHEIPDTENSKCKLLAELYRNFGDSELYWKPV